MFCMSSYGGKHFRTVPWNNLKQVFRLQSGHKYMIEIIIYNVQRAATAKVGKQELQFLCFTCHLMVVNILCSLMKISNRVFKLPSGHEYMTKISIYTVQRAITPKVGKPLLWFLISACSLLESFVKISQMVFKLQIGNEYMTKITIYHVQSAVTPKVGKPDLWFCKLCYGGKHFYNVSWNYLKQFSNYRDQHDFMTQITIYNVRRAITP